MPRTPVDEAASIIHCMLTFVRDSKPLPDPSNFSYTFSAGLAVAKSGDTLAEVYRRADLALYGAKVAGRDRLQINIDFPSAGKR